MAASRFNSNNYGGYPDTWLFSRQDHQWVFEQLMTAADVDSASPRTKAHRAGGVNSVCGCAAAKARQP
jgi:putative YphP/YqiW family bacilliredoxin